MGLPFFSSREASSSSPSWGFPLRTGRFFHKNTMESSVFFSWLGCRMPFLFDIPDFRPDPSFRIASSFRLIHISISLFICRVTRLSFSPPRLFPPSEKSISCGLAQMSKLFEFSLFLPFPNGDTPSLGASPPLPPRGRGPGFRFPPRSPLPYHACAIRFFHECSSLRMHIAEVAVPTP